jgi:hypothetical protein
MAQRCFDPGHFVQKISYTSLPKSGIWAGATTGNAELLKSKVAMVKSGLLIFQRTGSVRTHGVLPENSRKISLYFFLVLFGGMDSILLCLDRIDGIFFACGEARLSAEGPIIPKILLILSNFSL